MSFKLKIPENHLFIIEKILNLDENQKKILTTKFKNYKPSRFGEEPQIIEEIKDFPEIFDLLINLFRLYQNLLEDKLIDDIDDFIDQISNAFKRQIESEKIDDFENKIQSMNHFLKGLFTAETTFLYFEKAIKLLLERARLIENTRIITDIRPVFKEENIESPNYSLITHNLRIEYTKGLSPKKRVFFALDHQDLIYLQKQIKRALDKEEELQKLCLKAGLEIFEV